MPIIASGNTASIVIKEQPKKQTHVQEQSRIVPKEGTKLYVNGKERKIGKKSQYLLDMLTLED